MRIFKKKSERKKSIWKRAVDLALTDVRVAVRGVDQDFLEDLETRLLAADFGVPATLSLVDEIEGLAKRGKMRTIEDVRSMLRERIDEILRTAGEAELTVAADGGPTIYLMVGVNGVGKTTTIGKLAHAFSQQRQSVLLAAADTFRAGAVDQLRQWADRTGAEFVGGQQGGDPGAVAFDAIEAAVARGIDVVLIDTAGRLQTNRSLMDELRKVDRVIRNKLEGAPHEVLMVLDATIGQNAVSQLRAFRECSDVTGVVLAKMDSTARGGIVVSIAEEFGVPVKLVGIGEGLEDLTDFDSEDFVAGIFEEGPFEDVGSG